MEKVRYRRVGGIKPHYFQGKKIEPGQTFLAYPFEISEGHRDVIKAVHPEKEKEEPVVIETKFEVQSAGRGWYDVVNTISGKPLNNKKLRKEEAEKLFNSMK